MFKIDEEILTQEIIHFVIHSLYNMVSDIISRVWYLLNLAIFNVLGKIPEKDSNDVLGMILCDNLDDVHL